MFTANTLKAGDHFKALNGFIFPLNSYFHPVEMIVEYSEDDFIRVELINKIGQSKFVRYPFGLFDLMMGNFLEVCATKKAN